MTDDICEPMSDEEIDRCVKFVQTAEAQRLGEECKKLRARIAELEEALLQYADKTLWLCLDHCVRNCEFCHESNHIVFDGYDDKTPAWRIAEESLKKAGGGDV